MTKSKKVVLMHDAPPTNSPRTRAEQQRNKAQRKAELYAAAQLKVAQIWADYHKEVSKL